MSFYVTIFLVLFFFSFIEGQNLERRVTTYFYFLFCFIFFVLSFIRWETGTDWKSYYDYFLNFKLFSSDDAPFEWGFTLLVKTVAFFSNSYTVLLFICGFILFTFQSVSINKISPYPIISLWFLWSIQFANILFVRQWIAVAILIYSVTFIQKRRFIPFLLLVILASSFHISSLIFLAAWKIYNLEISRKKMIIILLTSVGFSVIFAKLIEILSGGLGGVIQARLDTYLSSEYNSEENEKLGIVSIIIKGFANKFLILLCSFCLYGKIIKRYPEFKSYLNLYWFGAVVYFTTISISLVFVRFSYVFDFFQIILVPYIFKVIDNNLIKTLAFIIFFAYLFLRMWQLLNGPYMEEFIPFKIIL